MARFSPFLTKSPHPKVGLKDDIRLYPVTKEALEALEALLAAGDGVESPTWDWTRDQCAEWIDNFVVPLFAEFLPLWAGPVPEEITTSVSKTDMEYEGIKIRILKATSAKETLPVVVYLHGGGFAVATSTGSFYDPYLTRLAALGECIIVAVDFVSTLDKPFPAGLDECHKVVKWVVAGGTPGVPKGKVTIAGDSAGGALAMGVTLRAKQEDWVSEIAGVYLLCPWLDGVTKDERYPSLEEFDGYWLNEGSIIAFITCLCKPSSKEEWLKNPQLFAMNATNDALQGLPPIKTIVMECDMIRDIGIAFHYKLKKAGVEASLEVISGGIHVQQLFTSHSPEVTNQSIHDLAAFAKYVSKKKE